jgi:hypothetical protein
VPVQHGLADPAASNYPAGWHPMPKIKNVYNMQVALEKVPVIIYFGRIDAEFEVDLPSSKLRAERTASSAS